MAEQSNPMPAMDDVAAPRRKASSNLIKDKDSALRHHRHRTVPCHCQAIWLSRITTDGGLCKLDAKARHLGIAAKAVRDGKDRNQVKFEQSDP